MMLGIDPGRYGAIAAVFGAQIVLLPLPDDLTAFADLIRGVTCCATSVAAAVERQQPFPRQGRTSIGVQMRGYGAILGMLATLNVPTTEIMPQVWRRRLGLGADKAESLRYCRERVPGFVAALDRSGCRRKDVAIGCADATCIALVARMVAPALG